MISPTFADGIKQLTIPEKLQVIEHLELLMGIGSGTSTEDSGEVAGLRALKANRAAKLVIFDVGANVGKYTDLAIKMLGLAARFEIHAFEPSPTTFAAYLQRHQGKPNVFPNNLGLADKEGTATLYMDEPLSGLASLTKRELGFYNIEHGARQETVRLTTLDAYCAAKGIPEIHLLKIDVEGHELDVLGGGRGLLGSKKVGIVTFEFGGCNIDTRTYFRDFFTFFSDHGYRLSRILPTGQLYPIERYHERLEKFSTSNYVATLPAARR